MYEYEYVFYVCMAEFMNEYVNNKNVNCMIIHYKYNTCLISKLNDLWH